MITSKYIGAQENNLLGEFDIYDYNILFAGISKKTKKYKRNTFRDLINLQGSNADITKDILDRSMREFTYEVFSKIDNDIRVIDAGLIYKRGKFIGSFKLAFTDKLFHRLKNQFVNGDDSDFFSFIENKIINDNVIDKEEYIKNPIDCFNKLDTSEQIKYFVYYLLGDDENELKERQELFVEILTHNSSINSSKALDTVEKVYNRYIRTMNNPDDEDILEPNDRVKIDKSPDWEHTTITVTAVDPENHIFTLKDNHSDNIFTVKNNLFKLNVGDERNIKYILKDDSENIIDKMIFEKLIEEYNNNGININVGDFIKVVAGRKIPINTVAKVIKINSEGYGGSYRDENDRAHAIANGWYNNTTYLYLDNGQRTNINNCVLATEEEIKNNYIAPEKELEVGDVITFDATVKETTYEDKPYIKYEFITPENKSYLAFISAGYPMRCLNGNYTAVVKSIDEKYGKKIIRINNVHTNKCNN